MKKGKKGFTLVEVLAVITILGIILVIAVPKINNYIDSNKKNTFIINARNIVRQIEYDNIDFKTFTKTSLQELDIKKISRKNFDFNSSVAYIVDDEIVLDLVGNNEYKNFYLCGVSFENEDLQVQETPCEEQNFVYIDFTVDLDGGSTAQNFNTKYISGNYLVLQIPVKTNDTFLGWELVSGNSTLDQNRIKFGTESTKIKAIWGNNPDLVLNLNGGTSSQKFDSKYSGGSLIILEEPTREGYKFKGWNIVIGNPILSGNILTTGTTNTVIEAIWELNEFAISYELNGGTLGENAPIIGISGESVIVSNPSKQGYTFKGWDVVGTGASMSGTILTMGSSNIILVANWEINNYTISYNLNGGSTEENPTNYTVETDTFTLNNPVKTGYTFTGWTDDNDNDLGDFVTISKGTFGDKRYIANYTINTYQINYVLDGGTSGSSTPTSGTYGSTVEISNPTRSGYTFAGWSVSGTGASLSGTNLTIGTGNITLTATWYKFPVLNASYPANATVVKYNSVTSKIEISENGDPANYTYQWYNNGTAVNGATSSSYTFTPTTVGTTTLYCKVTNSAGTVTTRTATITATGYYVIKNGISNVSVARNGVTTNASGSVMSISQSVALRDPPLYANFGPINVTNYKTLYVQFTGSYLNTAYTNSVGLSTSANNSSPAVVSIVGSGDTSKKALNVSGLSGNYYIIFRIESGSSGVGSRYMNVSNAWFE